MKITPDRLARGAFIYIRQSTVDQLANNHESRLRQYGLADRARALGWTDVTVPSMTILAALVLASAVQDFERLLAAICEGRVGAVFAIEASRLVRNGRDWHTLIEFCGLVGTVIVDEDGTYEPRHPNDRLLLGMKGTMSELELSLLRARSMEALKQKARRGELFFTAAVGYVKVGRDKIEMDPDLRVREAIGLVFTRFAEMQSIRRVFLSLRGDQIALPSINSKNSGQHQLLWKLPVYATVNNLLTNPVYAGAYACGRTGSWVMIENGRKRILRGYRKNRSDWAVLLIDHHELVQAHQRVIGIVRPRVYGQHIFHGGYEGAVGLWMTQHCLRCGLRQFFSVCARSLSRLRARQCRVPRPCSPAGAASSGRAPSAARSTPGRSAWLLSRRRKPQRRALSCAACGSTPLRSPLPPVACVPGRSWTHWCPRPG